MKDRLLEIGFRFAADKGRGSGSGNGDTYEIESGDARGPAKVVIQPGTGDRHGKIVRVERPGKPKAD